MEQKAGKQYFKWKEHLTEAAAQFGTDRTWQSWDSSGAMTKADQRMRKIARKKIEKVCNNFQGHAGGKAIGIQQHRVTGAHMR